MTLGQRNTHPIEILMNHLIPHHSFCLHPQISPSTLSYRYYHQYHKAKVMVS